MAKVDASYHIASPVIAMHEGAAVAEAIELMNEKKISSLLIHNDKNRITGILTERDILRKIVLLDIEDKLERGVGLVATREVYFADADRLHESVVRLHFEKKIRHFPVLEGKDQVLENVVGMVTVTDIIRHYLHLEYKSAKPSSRRDPNLRPLSVICKHQSQLELYDSQFSKFKFEVTRVTDADQFFRDHAGGEVPLIFDLDGYAQKDLSNLIVLTKKYRGHLIMSVSNPAVVSLFRKYMDKDRQTIAQKPLDVDYLVWLLTQKWPQIKAAKSLGSK